MRALQMGDSRTRSVVVDRAGIVASSACALHCAICLLLPNLLIAAGLGTLLSHEAEWAFTLFASAIALLALSHGWLRHRSRLVVLLFAIGVAGLFASRLLEESAELAGTVVGVVAAVGLVAAHVTNLAMERKTSLSCDGAVS